VTTNRSVSFSQPHFRVLVIRELFGCTGTIKIWRFLRWPWSELLLSLGRYRRRYSLREAGEVRFREEQSVDQHHSMKCPFCC
jgi:hypothetical protein